MVSPADPRVWEERQSDRDFADFLARCRVQPARPHAVLVSPPGALCPPDHEHEITCYRQHGCRCDDCRTAQRERLYYYRHMRKAGRIGDAVPVDGRGARRRLQSLMAIGWRTSDLAARMGVSIDRVRQIRVGKHRQLTPATIATIAALYEDLWAVVPEPSTDVERVEFARAIAYARRNGFVPPLAWDDIDTDEQPPTPEPTRPDDVDDVAVTLAVAGDKVTLTPAERRAAVRILHRERMNDFEIAARLRCSDRTVLRIRQELGLPEVFGQIEWRPRPSSTKEAA